MEATCLESCVCGSIKCPAVCGNIIEPAICHPMQLIIIFEGFLSFRNSPKDSKTQGAVFQAFHCRFGLWNGRLDNMAATTVAIIALTKRKMK